MSTLKLARLLRKTFEAECVEVLSERMHNGHLRFELKHPDGRVQKLTAAGSPSVFDRAVLYATKSIRRFRGTRET